MSNVTVYGTTWCAFCKAAKNYLDSKHVAYTDINIEQDQQATELIVEKTKQMGVPVIQIGDKFIVGFNKQELETTLLKEGLL